MLLQVEIIISDFNNVHIASLLTYESILSVNLLYNLYFIRNISLIKFVMIELLF